MSKLERTLKMVFWGFTLFDAVPGTIFIFFGQYVFKILNLTEYVQPQFFMICSVPNDSFKDRQFWHVPGGKRFYKNMIIAGMHHLESLVDKEACMLDYVPTPVNDFHFINHYA